MNASRHQSEFLLLSFDEFLSDKVFHDCYFDHFRLDQRGTGCEWTSSEDIHGSGGHISESPEWKGCSPETDQSVCSKL